MYVIIIITSTIFMAGVVTGATIVFCTGNMYRQRHARAPSRNPTSLESSPKWHAVSSMNVADETPVVDSLTDQDTIPVAHAIGHALSPGIYLSRAITDFEGNGYVTIDSHDITVQVSHPDTAYEGDVLAVKFDPKIRKDR